MCSNKFRKRTSKLAIREVLIPVVNCLELATVDGNVGLGEQVQTTAHDNEISADAANGLAVVLTKIGDRFEMETAGQ